MQITLPTDLNEALQSASAVVEREIGFGIYDYLLHQAEHEYDYVLYRDDLYPNEIRQMLHMIDFVYEEAHKFIKRDIPKGAKGLQFVVVKDKNMFSQYYTFTKLDDAREFFRRMLESEYKKYNTDVDDNGEDIDECVRNAQALVDDHWHQIEFTFYMG